MSTSPKTLLGGGEVVIQGLRARVVCLVLPVKLGSHRRSCPPVVTAGMKAVLNMTAKRLTRTGELHPHRRKM
jgi:hypothetical protein